MLNATESGTTKIYISRLNLTGHFRSNEIKSAGTVLFNTEKNCADSQRNFISARAQNSIAVENLDDQNLPFGFKLIFSFLNKTREKKCCFRKCFKATNVDRFNPEGVSDFRQALTSRNKQCFCCVSPYDSQPIYVRTCKL